MKPIHRFETLDYVRGLAALAVVFFHRGIYSSFQGLLYILAKYGEVGVQIFFVISGFVIYQSMERHIKLGNKGSVIFLKKRFVRIFPALWTSLCLAFLVATLF